jgi:uncharacterized protein (TIGR02246 family)
MQRLYLNAILISSLAIIGLALACQQAPPPSPPDTRAADEGAVREAEAAWAKAAAAKDIEGYLSFFADDAVELPPNAPLLRGKESMRKGLSEAMANPGFTLGWQANKVAASRGGDLAYSIGTYQSTMNDAKGKLVTDRGKYVTLWQKQPDGNWKVVADIYNSDLPAPEAAKH